LYNLKKENKPIKVAFIINDKSTGKYDASKPENGNPGIGGTQYCFIALATELAKRDNSIMAVLFHNNKDAVVSSLLDTRCVEGGDDELAHAVIEYNPDFAVVRGAGDLLHSPLFKQNEIPLIAWIHNHLKRKELDAIGCSHSICHSVFCGKEQRMLSYDTAIFEKSSSIFNMHFSVTPSQNTKKNPASAVYIGSVISSKGLHRLLRLWPKIKQKVPEAKLNVIGSGALYNTNAKLGPNNLADERYERKLFGYLENNPEKYGVTFHGLLRVDKYKVLESCVVGIPNPTALTECCPGSVLECSAAGLALVGNRKFGMVDTIVDKKTGYLTDNDSMMIEKITELFRNQKKAEEMGREGIKFVDSEFSADSIALKWEYLIKILKEENAKLIRDEELILQGNYRYKSVIRSNQSGKIGLLSKLKDVLAKIELAELKLR
jgi:glycosyltransferase involved in cell wall biosynthesis